MVFNCIVILSSDTSLQCQPLKLAPVYNVSKSPPPPTDYRQLAEQNLIVTTTCLIQPNRFTVYIIQSRQVSLHQTSSKSDRLTIFVSMFWIPTLALQCESGCAKSVRLGDTCLRCTDTVIIMTRYERGAQAAQPTDRRAYTCSV